MSFGEPRLRKGSEAAGAAGASGGRGGTGTCHPGPGGGRGPALLEAQEALSVSPGAARGEGGHHFLGRAVPSWGRPCPNV